MNVLLSIGTRPQYIKASVMHEEAKKQDVNFWICDTGQHYDPEMSDVFKEELEFEPDVTLGVGSDGPHQVRRIIEGLENAFGTVYFDWILTIGDTNSTLASSMWAFLTNRKQAHIEAGMRSFDWWLPEERNRVVVDSLSDLLFCPNHICYLNLLPHLDKEQEPFVVGDLSYDLFNKYYPLTKGYDYWVNGGYVLLTIHRQENMDELFMSCLFDDIESDGRDFIFLMHPRTEKFIKDNINRTIPENLFMEKPVGYFTMLSLIKGADEVWTDSGGLQRECIFANKECTILRENDEWQGTNPKDFGDGKTASKIFSILDEYNY
jgi:UDP-GlcNAc3NAcA epimerase